MRDTETTDRAIYALLLATIMLAVLKITSVIDIPWSIALLPVWLPFVVLVGVLIVMSVKSLMEVIKNDRL